MVKATISRIGLDYSISRVTVYRVIRIRGGKDENLDVRDGNRSSKKTRINFDKLYWHTCSFFFSLSRVNLFPKLVSSLLEIDATCRPNAINFCLSWYYILLRFLLDEWKVESDPRAIKKYYYRGL